ncbi:GIY-YIG nuclease family protein [Leeuwenhoekiella nanhaiensis]|uniref:Uncharacterized protein n=1 Tax=Leeuwenhoekiella nanhaiensis TaxID=1655491 RepID=A0A2G1VM00_9FLAO|nr:GIY-YIG nuclease family protein [Leeuwenhoekiella nanhaiensis]PHQ27796.1 hypothetical protein CJ305_18240 [Leeuwenhoekiella nanhaiensis]
MEAKYSNENIDKAKEALTSNHAQLVKTFIKKNGISKSLLTEQSGVYIFWWEGSLEGFTKTVTSSIFLINGKKTHKEQIKICFTKEWIKKATHHNKVCLYVGKTTNLRDRISKHLKLGSPTLWKNKKRNSGSKPNTVSQMRIGLETVYNKDMLEEIKNQVSISYHPMNKYSESINRFYVEDFLIAHYFPLFNIDIER